MRAQEQNQQGAATGTAPAHKNSKVIKNANHKFFSSLFGGEDSDDL